MKAAIWSIRLGLSLFVWSLVPGVASAVVELRVAVQAQADRLQIGSSTEAVIRDNAGRELGKLSALQSLEADVDGGKVALSNDWRGDRLWIEPSEGGYVWIGQRWYRGRVQLALVGGDRFAAINYVDLEQYLYSVVGSEVVPSWPIEALKAQAVAARTYALYERARSQGKLFDLTNTTNSQVYKGITSESDRTHAAVNETVGQVVTHDGQLILAAFHASSGGHTENVEDVWTRPLPYLRGVADYDRDAPVYEWTEAITSATLGSKLGIGPVQSVRVERTTPRGRVITLSVVGESGNKRLSGEEFRKALNLRSTLFAVSEDSGTFQFSGRGFGHGVGMSQWGAYHLALQGTNYQQILGHYYQNAILARVQVQ